MGWWTRRWWNHNVVWAKFSRWWEIPGFWRPFQTALDIVSWNGGETWGSTRLNIQHAYWKERLGRWSLWIWGEYHDEFRIDTWWRKLRIIGMHGACLPRANLVDSAKSYYSFNSLDLKTSCASNYYYGLVVCTNRRNRLRYQDPEIGNCVLSKNRSAESRISWYSLIPIIHKLLSCLQSITNSRSKRGRKTGNLHLSVFES